jgi:uncharacterized protein YkwD
MEINFARTSPKAYAAFLAQEMGAQTPIDRPALREAIRFLQRAKPLPPLEWSEGMSAGALLHVSQQGPRGSVGHRGPGQSGPAGRISKFGSPYGGVGENIHYGAQSPRNSVARRIIDAGVPNRGHRKNIFTRAFGVAGVASGSHARFGSMCVIDFAGGFAGNASAIAAHRDPSTLAGKGWMDL